MTLPYREGVGMMVLNNMGLVFVAKRIDMTSEAWQMPQGGIDEGEEPLEAATRELFEETGIRKTTFIGESKYWYTYDLPADLVPKLWGGRYRGQKQKWFVLRFNGADADINIATQHPEFSEWKWVKPDQLPDIIVPFKRQMYADIVKEFRPLITKNL